MCGVSQLCGEKIGVILSQQVCGTVFFGWLRPRFLKSHLLRLRFLTLNLWRTTHGQRQILSVLVAHDCNPAIGGQEQGMV